MKRKVYSIVTALAMLAGTLQPYMVSGAESYIADEAEVSEAVVDEGNGLEAIVEDVAETEAVADLAGEDASEEEITGVPALAHTHCACGSSALTNCGEAEHSSGTVWTEWDPSGGAKLPEATGNYYLTDDVHLDRDYTVPEGADVKLCLNGNTIYTEGYCYTTSGTLTVTNCKGVQTGGINATYVSDGFTYASTPLCANYGKASTLNVYNTAFNGENVDKINGYEFAFVYAGKRDVSGDYQSDYYSSSLNVSGCRFDLSVDNLYYEGGGYVAAVREYYAKALSVRNSTINMSFASTSRGVGNYAPLVRGIRAEYFKEKVTLDTVTCRVDAYTGGGDASNIYSDAVACGIIAPNDNSNIDAVSIKNCDFMANQYLGDKPGATALDIEASDYDYDYIFPVENTSLSAWISGGDVENTDKSAKAVNADMNTWHNNSKLAFKSCNLSAAVGDEEHPGSGSVYGIYSRDGSISIDGSETNPTVITVNTFGDNNKTAAGVYSDNASGNVCDIKNATITVNGGSEAKSYGVYSPTFKTNMESSTVTVTGDDTSVGVYAKMFAYDKVTTFRDSVITAPLYGIYATNKGCVNYSSILLDNMSVTATLAGAGEALHVDDESDYYQNIYLSGLTHLSGDKCGIYKAKFPRIFACGYKDGGLNPDTDKPMTVAQGDCIMIFPDYEVTGDSTIITGGMSGSLLGKIDLVNDEGYSIGADGKTTTSSGKTTTSSGKTTSSSGKTTTSSGKTTSSSEKTTSSSGKGSTSSSSSGSGSSSSAPAPAAEPLTGPLKLTDIKSSVTGEDGKAVLDSVEAVSYVTYNGKTHTVPALAKSSKVTGDIEVKVSGDILKYATVAYKFKNNKEVSEKKQHYFTISFKPIKGVTTPAQKKVIKALNKDVKKKRATFDIKPASLSGAKIVKKKFNKKKTNISDLSVTIGNYTFKLGKKDYTPKVAEKGIEVQGKGNFKDTLLVPFE